MVVLCVQVFRALNIRTIIRLNSERYQSQTFLDAGAISEYSPYAYTYLSTAGVCHTHQRGVEEVLRGAVVI
jgi:hypothetical protein